MHLYKLYKTLFYAKKITLKFLYFTKNKLSHSFASFLRYQTIAALTITNFEQVF